MYFWSQYVIEEVSTENNSVELEEGGKQFQRI
jgi:hypothetical protein